MMWSLCLRQGHSVSALTPIETGTFEDVMRLAADRYRVLRLIEHPDGRAYGGQWQRDESGRSVPYAIVPAAMVAAHMRRQRP